MNFIHKLAIKNLKLNKKRTILIIIGVILSTALYTAIATLATSYIHTEINNEKNSGGNYHYQFSYVPVDEIKYIENNRNVKEIYITQNIGYAPFENRESESKPYLHIQAFEEKALKNLDIVLREGKMPKNEDEIVIPDTAEYKIGDILSLNIGKRIRVFDGKELQHDYENNTISIYEKEETFEPEYMKKYKIVGIIENLAEPIEYCFAPAKTAITYLENVENISGTTNIYTIYKDLKKQNETTAQILGVDSKEFEKITSTIYENFPQDDTNILKYNYYKREYLIKLETLDVSITTVSDTYWISTMVMLITIFTSVFCIKSIFDISIVERIKQYGMLVSVGMTSKQIKKNLLYEGLVLGIIGIPLGILSGFLIILIFFQIVQNLIGYQFIFKTSIEAIAITILLVEITIIISARIVARKVSKVSPMEAIRNIQEIKNRKRLKSTLIIKKIFGVGGDIANKNLKRNKKKNRVTTIVIVLLVALFILTSSFFSYWIKFLNEGIRKRNYNIVVKPKEDSSYEESDFDKINEIVSQKRVKNYSIINNIWVKVEREELRKHYSNIYKENGTEIIEEVPDNKINIIISVINENAYKAFAKKIGIRYEEAKDKAILIDEVFDYYENEEGKLRQDSFRRYNYKRGDKIEFELTDGSKGEIEIIKTTNKRTIGLEDRYEYDQEYAHGDICYFVVSEEWFNNNYKQYSNNGAKVYINSNDAQELKRFVEQNFSDKFLVYDYEKEIKEENAFKLITTMPMYGFMYIISLIVLISISNVIATNLNLRSREFANLKSIGMTSTEFNRMILLEIVFYCVKFLFWGNLIGGGLSYLIYKIIENEILMEFIFPWKGITISSIAVTIIITIIMYYSLKRINKQNIIETIRNDNI